MQASKTMILGSLVLISSIFLSFSHFNQPLFIPSKNELKRHYNQQNAVLIASTGRSGSTMLATMVLKYAPGNQILKTHLLPDSNFKGKILFIFSNPDKAAESALHIMLHDGGFGELHFRNVETSDISWLRNIGNTTKQTVENNLLAYDALGCCAHLEAWLCERTLPCDLASAQILALKLENLWENESVEAIKDFLGIPDFRLPAEKTRGYSGNKLLPNESAMRKRYNLGTEAEPRYEAYIPARVLWEQAPAFQFLKIL